MKFFQKEMILPRYRRGFHLITDQIRDEFSDIKNIDIGILHILVKHTSAGITINENADPTVRQDFESHFNKSVPENAPYYRHNYEGPDDMPAHIKTSIVGNEINIPITKGKLNLGTWQGIYFCEFRNYGINRHIVLTAYGE
ncbi:MAG: secondary thiamine-phosphate synthase enzyme YjbQ [Cyclobacteriaceae bacterium]|jgi:secondary thiamine-phosphate synthase enzyme